LLNLLDRPTLPTMAVDKYVDTVQKSHLNTDRHWYHHDMPNY